MGKPSNLRILRSRGGDFLQKILASTKRISDSFTPVIDKHSCKLWSNFQTQIFRKLIISFHPCFIQRTIVIDAFGSAFFEFQIKILIFRLGFLQGQIAVFDKNRNNVCSCLKTSQKSKAWGSAIIPEGSGMNFRVDHWKRSTDFIDAKPVGSGLPYFTDLFRPEDGEAQIRVFLKTSAWGFD